MSLLDVKNLAITGYIEGEVNEEAPDGDGLVTAALEEGHVIQVPNGSTINGLRLFENGQEWSSTDGWYFMRICAPPGGTATISLESGSVASAYRIFALGAWSSALVIGPTPIGIGFSAGVGAWFIQPPSHPIAIGSAMAWLGGAVPAGWLAAGTTVSRTTYAGLFAALGANAGPGDGSTTFDIPTPSALTVGSWIVFAGV